MNKLLINDSEIYEIVAIIHLFSWLLYIIEVSGVIMDGVSRGVSPSSVRIQQTEKEEQAKPLDSAARSCSQADDGDMAELTMTLQNADMDFTAASSINRKRYLSSSSSNSEEGVENNEKSTRALKYIRRAPRDDIDLASIEKNGKPLMNEQNTVGIKVVNPKPVMATSSSDETVTEQQNTASN